MAIPSKKLEGKYEILEKISEGGMGAIYKVRHRLLGEERVVKVMRPHLHGDSGFRDRFLAEARAATQLSHPNIAQVFDYTVDDDGIAYIVMELIRGRSLEQLIEVGEPLPLALVLEIARQSLRAIGHIHQRNVAHRDISPDNLMLTCDVDGRPLVKVIDLGIAKDPERAGPRTGAGVFLGKLRYAAPETFDEEQSGDRRLGDLYAFGLVLYELLTGTSPIAGDSPSSLIAGHLFRQPVDFGESDPAGGVPEDVRHATLKALAKSPGERFADAESFAAALAGGPRLDLQAPEIRRVLRLTEGESPSAIRAARRPGSTQSRLDRQFLAESTPSPASAAPATALPVESPADEAETRILAAVRSDSDPSGKTAVAPPLPDWDPETTRAMSWPTEVADLAAENTTSIIPPNEPLREAEPAALTEAVEAIRGLRDEGRAGEALKELNKTVRILGSPPVLQTLRHELGEALLEREAEEEDTASRMFEAVAEPAQQPEKTVAIRRPAAAPPSAPPPAASPPAVPRPAVPPQRSLSDATIRSSDGAPAPSPERPEPPEAHPNRSMVAAGLILAAVLALVVYFLTRQDQAPEGDLAAQDVEAAVLSPGSLALDAVPWAEIVSIENPDAEDDPPITPSPSRFTPVILRLPPGEYRITLRYPPTGREEERVVRIASDQRVEERVTFLSLDGNQYFERVGW